MAIGTRIKRPLLKRAARTISMMMSGESNTSSKRGARTGLRARRISSHSRESPAGSGSALSPGTGTTELSPGVVVVVVVDPPGKTTTPGLVVEPGVVMEVVVEETALVVVVGLEGAVVEPEEVVVDVVGWVVVVVVVGVVVVVVGAGPSTSRGQEWRSISKVTELTSRIAI